MKVLVCLLAIVVAFVGAASIMEDSTVSRSLSSRLEDAIISIREQMPCGYPNLGIPPVAPLVIDNYNVNIDLPGFGFNGSIDNFILRNLDNFEINKIELNIFESTLSFSLTFRDVRFSTFYKMKLFLERFGFTINLIGDVHAELNFKEFEISGSVEYNVISNKLKIESFIVRVHLGEVESNIDGVFNDQPITEKMNKLLEEFLPIIVNNNEKLITETVQSIVLPVANYFLGAYELDELDELLDLINGVVGEPVKCEPPQEQELY